MFRVLEEGFFEDEMNAWQLAEKETTNTIGLHRVSLHILRHTDAYLTEDRSSVRIVSFPSRHVDPLSLCASRDFR
jgi:hypothetical protein